MALCCLIFTFIVFLLYIFNLKNNIHSYKFKYFIAIFMVISLIFTVSCGKKTDNLEKSKISEKQNQEQVKEDVKEEQNLENKENSKSLQELEKTLKNGKLNPTKEEKEYVTKMMKYILLILDAQKSIIQSLENTDKLTEEYLLQVKQKISDAKLYGEDFIEIIPPKGLEKAHEHNKKSLESHIKFSDEFDKFMVDVSEEHIKNMAEISYDIYDEIDMSQEALTEYLISKQTEN